MSRLLPIVLLALGLVLTFSVLAAAKTPDMPAGPDGILCIEETHSTLVAEARPPEPKAMRCWKKLGMGLAATSCGPEPILGAQTALPAPPRATHAVSGQTMPLAQCAGPDLDLPPPRA